MRNLIHEYQKFAWARLIYAWAERTLPKVDDLK